MKNIIEKCNLLIQNKEIILIDCFDTLVYRTCSPERVIRRWIGNIADRYDIDSNCIYKCWKATTEKQLISNRAIGIDEIPFDKMCRELWVRLKMDILMPVPFDDFYSTILDMMISIEEAVTHVDLELLEFVSKAYEKGKRIYCVSDFYLPQIAIERILTKHEIIEYISGIFISSDIGKRKSTGRLYQYVLNNLCCNPAETIMIGDNVHSDIKMASLNGISTIHYKNKRKKYKDYFNDYFFKNLAEYNQMNNMPYANYGFSLYLFNKKLYETLKQVGYKKVYFFAREGEYLKKSFDIFLKKKQISNIETEYLYVSRQATLLPSLRDITIENFDILKKQIRSISLEDFLKNINLKERVLEADFWVEKYDLKKKESNFFESETFKNFIREEYFVKIYDQERKRANDEIRLYLRQVGISEESSKIVVVDIGWKGSIQDNLSRILGEKCTIIGYYYGLLGDVYVSDNNEKRGLIFSEIPYRKSDFDIYKTSYRMLERILYASHGSCLRYENTKPILDSFDDAESELYEFVKPIQERMIEMMQLICDHVSELMISDDELNEAIRQQHLEFILNITKGRMQQMYYMNERQKMNFGDWGNKKNVTSVIYKQMRNFKNMSRVEQVNKLLIILSKVNMWKVIRCIKGIFIHIFIKRSK